MFHKAFNKPRLLLMILHQKSHMIINTLKSNTLSTTNIFATLITSSEEDLQGVQERFFGFQMHFSPWIRHPRDPGPRPKLLWEVAVLFKPIKNFGGRGLEAKSLT